MDEGKNIEKDDEIDLRENFRVFVKRKWWFLGSVLIILVIGLLYVFMQPASYLLTYKIEVNENYYNKSLSELYPNYEKELNYISLINVPVIFKSEYGFESLDGISKEGIDYNGLRKSESVKISLNENTSMFNISVSNPDYDLADKIAKTLIDAFDNSIKNKEKTILNEITGKIEQDIKDLENENINYENTVLVNLEANADNLYAELNKYIVDYNVSLSDELEKNKKIGNVSFYNIIIPPNDISDKISKLQGEIDLYRQKILENKNEIIVLNNLHENLLKDENIILNRIDLVSEKPYYTTPNNRLRNLAIVIVLSLLAGAVVVFIVNFGFGLKKRKDAKL